MCKNVADESCHRTNKMFDKSCRKCTNWKPFIDKKKKSTYKYLNKIYKTHKNYKIHTEVKKCQGRLVGKNWKTATVYD